MGTLRVGRESILFSANPETLRTVYGTHLRLSNYGERKGRKDKAR